MNKLRQSLRRKKDVYVPESSRPHQWQTDEEAVRSGKCNFAVKVIVRPMLAAALTDHKQPCFPNGYVMQANLHMALHHSHTTMLSHKCSGCAAGQESPLFLCFCFVILINFSTIVLFEFLFFGY